MGELMSDAGGYASSIHRLLRSWETQREPEKKLLHLLTAQTTAVAQAREVPDAVRTQLLTATYQQLKEFDSSRIHSSRFSYVERYIFKKILSDLRKSIKGSAARGQVPLY
jgi:hypothetical protein